MTNRDTDRHSSRRCCEGPIWRLLTVPLLEQTTLPQPTAAKAAVSLAATTGCHTTACAFLARLLTATYVNHKTSYSNTQFKSTSWQFTQHAQQHQIKQSCTHCGPYVGSRCASRPSVWLRGGADKPHGKPLQWAFAGPGTHCSPLYPPSHPAALGHELQSPHPACMTTGQPKYQQ